MMFVLPWKAGLFGHGNEIEMHRCFEKNCLIRLHKSCAHFQGIALFKQQTTENTQRNSERRGI